MVLDHDFNRGDNLLSRLMDGEVGGELENRLLDELHRGYPVTKLRLLLNAEKDKVVAAGMWLMSELGADARPLFDDVVRLINYPSAHVRFFALDCLSSCVRPEDQQAITLGLGLLDDHEPSVRWKAMMFLATVPDAVLRTALNMGATNHDSGAREKGLRLLLDSAISRDTSAIVAALLNSDAVLRGYAAAAAARAVPWNPIPLKHAMASEDLTVKQFAKDVAARAGVATS